MILPDLMASPKTEKKVVPVPKFKLRAAIQGKLICLRDESVFAESVRDGAVNDLSGTLKMILEQAEDNRPMVERIIGGDLLKVIEKM